MIRTSRFAIACTALISVSFIANARADQASRLSPSLSSLAASPNAQDSMVRVLVFVSDDHMQSQVQKLATMPDLNRPARLKSVVGRLMNFRTANSDSVERFLMARSTTAVERHWISPAFVATIPASQLTELSQMAGVAEVAEDLPVEIEQPMATSTAPSLVASAVSNELGMLKIPVVWGSGLNGAGRIVCNFDTGVEGTHPALSARWRGNHVPTQAAWFCPMQPASLPFDKAGHGTHTMGIMLGSTASDSFGVAPGAEWIAAGVVDQGADLTTTFSHILSAFEWALNPDGDTMTTDDVPDVILNSWGVPTIQPSAIAPCSTLFWQAIDNVEAAGVVVVFAAGNEGRLGPATVRNPANRATTPYNAFSVGAVDGNRVIADFSGRGPSSCDPTQIKPEVVAPGVSIRSCTKDGTYAYMTGTSMAAPYIAGLVAICRQYNPDATPDQIKYAIMKSAADLGAAGEDNDYGWGLPDAAKMLTYLPVPNNHLFAIARRSILGDGIARPGETVSLQLWLTDTAAVQGTLQGEIRSSDQYVSSIPAPLSDFVFGDGGSTAISATPFSFQMSPYAPNGSTIWFQLYLKSAGVLLDSIRFSIFVGYPPAGTTAEINTGRISYTVSDFGQYGLDQASIYNLGGQGFRVDGGTNLLYEAGIIAGRNLLQQASSIRDSVGLYRPSDFRPTEQLSSEWTDAYGAIHRSAGMDDSKAAISIPVSVNQDIVHYSAPGEAGYLVCQYRIVNRSLERQTGIRFGYFTDFDLSDGADRTRYREDLGLLYQTSTWGTAVGLVTLDDKSHLISMTNGAAKRGFTAQQKLDLLSSSAIDSMTVGDMMMIVVAGPFDLGAGDSAVARFALVAGADLTELFANAALVRQRNNLPTTVDDPNGQLPGSFVLAQNYPNPFNPSTTISFTLERAEQVKLELFDCLGRSVSVLLEERLGAGRHQIVWNAVSNGRGHAASGVYFYRLTAGGQSESRKMLLLK